MTSGWNEELEDAMAMDWPNSDNADMARTWHDGHMKLTHTTGVVLGIGAGLLILALVMLALIVNGLTPNMPGWAPMIPGALGILLAALALLFAGVKR